MAQKMLFLSLWDCVITYSAINLVTPLGQGLLPSELKAKVKSLSPVQLFATPWTVACQALPCMGFSKQEYWSGLLFPSPGDLLDTGIEPGSPTLQADSLPSEPPGKTYQSSN